MSLLQSVNLDQSHASGLSSFPLTIAVYWPGASIAIRADSRGSVQAETYLFNVSWLPLLPVVVLDRVKPLASLECEGPDLAAFGLFQKPKRVMVLWRRTTTFGSCLETMKPPVMTLSPQENRSARRDVGEFRAARGHPTLALPQIICFYHGDARGVVLATAHDGAIIPHGLRSRDDGRLPAVRPMGIDGWWR